MFHNPFSHPKKGVDKKVLVLVDWDNLFISLYNKFRSGINLEYRIQKMMEWVGNEVGEILGGRGFVFAPEHLNYTHQALCQKHNLQLITCPKKQVKDSEGIVIDEQDVVDADLMWFASIMMKHPDIGFICLVSGDDDYVPMMEEAGRLKVKRALIPPTIDSLSKSKRLLETADKHPKTRKRMILRMDTL